MTETLDVLAVGNAIVDVLAPVDDHFLATQGLDKGSMRLIDAAEAERLYRALPPAREVSGGSAANTAAGVAALGGRAGVRRTRGGRHAGTDFRARHPRRGRSVTRPGPAVPSRRPRAA